MKKTIILNQNFEWHSDLKTLSKEDKGLILKAVKISKKAHAPYSEFQVGSAVLLDNGIIVTGNNQENAAYPSGLCAERVALFYASSQYPGNKIKTIAITAKVKKGKTKEPIPPCGACRQALVEYETKFKHDIRIIMTCETGKSYISSSASSLLPFTFEKNKLI